MRGKRITEIEFKKIKELLALGLTVRQMKKVSGRSHGVIVAINKTDSFDDFYKKERDYRKDLESRRNPLTGKVDKQTLDEHSSTVVMLKSLEHNQTRIITLLEEIVKNTTKKGLFS